jgi:hypothetical protein
MRYAIGGAASNRIQAKAAGEGRPVRQDERTVSGRELVGEAINLAAGLGILLLPLAPFALPALALAALGVSLATSDRLVAQPGELRLWRGRHQPTSTRWAITAPAPHRSSIAGRRLPSGHRSPAATTATTAPRR